MLVRPDAGNIKLAQRRHTCANHIGERWFQYRDFMRAGRVTVLCFSNHARQIHLESESASNLLEWRCGAFDGLRRLLLSYDHFQTPTNRPRNYGLVAESSPDHAGLPCRAALNCLNRGGLR